MVRALAIDKKDWQQVIGLYQSGSSMREVAEQFAVSIDAIVYILRKSKTPRRSITEARHNTFLKKKPSFVVRTSSALKRREIDLIGAALYWAEGYKTSKAAGVDFANSDPDMAQLFLLFLRKRYKLDTDRLFFQVYYYADQNIQEITAFWSKKLGVPLTSFRSPYKKVDFKPHAKKLPYGVLHIRYNDKKLLWDVLNLINSCKVEFCVDGGAV